MAVSQADLLTHAESAVRGLSALCCNRGVKNVINCDAARISVWKSDTLIGGGQTVEFNEFSRWSRGTQQQPSQEYRILRAGIYTHGNVIVQQWRT